MSNCWFRELACICKTVHCSWKSGVDEFSPFSQCTHTQQVDTPWNVFISVPSLTVHKIRISSRPFQWQTQDLRARFISFKYILEMECIIILKWKINSNYEHNMLSTLYFFLKISEDIFAKPADVIIKNILSLAVALK